MLVLQSCTDSVQVLPGSSCETFPSSSDGKLDIGNIKFEEDVDMTEEKLNVKAENGIGIEEEECIDIKVEEGIHSEEEDGDMEKEEEEYVDIREDVSHEDTLDNVYICMSILDPLEQFNNCHLSFHTRMYSHCKQLQCWE